MEFQPSNFESLLPEGYHARLVWSYVEQQNLKGLYDIIQARQGSEGRGAIAPEILFALWLYATIDYVGGARELERLTLAHDAYIAGYAVVCKSTTTRCLNSVLHTVRCSTNCSPTTGPL